MSGGFNLGNLGAAIGGAIQGAIGGFKDALGGSDAQGMQGAGSLGSSMLLPSDEGVNGASIMGDDADSATLAGGKTISDMAAELGSLFATEATDKQEEDEALDSMLTWAGHEIRIDYDGDGIWDVIKYVEDWSGVHRVEEQSAQGEEEAY